MQEINIAASQIINTLGLSVNATGAALAFVFAYQQPAKQEQVPPGLGADVLLNDGRTVAEHNEQNRRMERRVFILSRVGYGLMSIGFTLQLIATWIPR